VDRQRRGWWWGWNGKESEPRKKYDAFISYRRQPDEAIARALQEGLQTLAKPWTKWRAIRVFRDVTSIPATSNLTKAIQQRLDDSEWFILLASPDSFKPTQGRTTSWVEEELRYWLEHGGGVERLLVVRTGGTFRHDRTLGLYDEEGKDWLPAVCASYFTTQPKYEDLGWARELNQPDGLSLRSPDFARIVASLSEPIRGVDRERLFSEDGVQHRKARLFRTAAITGLSLTTVISIITAVWALLSAHVSTLNEQRATASFRRQEIAATQAKRNTLLAQQATLLATVQEAIAQAGKRGAEISGEQATFEAEVATRKGMIADLNAKEATLERDEARRQAQISEARRLAALSSSMLKSFPQRAALLASKAETLVQAQRLTEVPEPLEALRRAANVFGGSVVLRHAGLRCSELSPNGRIFATGGDDNIVRLWRTNQPSLPPVVLRGHTAAVTHLTFSPNGRWLVSGCEDQRDINLSGRDNRALLWDLQHPHFPARALTIPESYRDEAVECIFAPRGDWLAVLFAKGELRLWPIRNSGSLGNPIELAEATWASCIAFSPDGKWLTAGTRIPSIKVWKLSGISAKNQPIERLGNAGKWVTSVRFSPDSQWLVSTSKDVEKFHFAFEASSKDVLLWKMSADGPLDTSTKLSSTETSNKLDAVAFSGDSQWLAMGAGERNVRLWRLPEAGVPVAYYQFLNDADSQSIVTSTAFSGASDYFAAGDSDGSIHIWRLPVTKAQGNFQSFCGFGKTTVEPELFRSLPQSSTGGGVYSLLFRSEETRPYLYSGSEDGSVRRWEVYGGAPSLVMGGHEGAANKLVFNPTGGQFISSSTTVSALGITGDGSARLVNFHNETGGAGIVPLGRLAWNAPRSRRSQNGKWLIMESEAPQNNGQPSAEPYVPHVALFGLESRGSERSCIEWKGSSLSEQSVSGASSILVTGYEDSLTVTNLTDLKRWDLKLPGRLRFSDLSASTLCGVTSIAIKTKTDAVFLYALRDREKGKWVNIGQAPDTESPRPGEYGPSTTYQQFSSSPDGQWLCAAWEIGPENRDTSTITRRGQIRVWNTKVKQGDNRFHLPQNFLPQTIIFGKNRLIVTEARGGAIVWSLNRTEAPLRLRVEPGSYEVPFQQTNGFLSPDGRYLATLSDRSAFLWDLTNNLWRHPNAPLSLTDNKQAQAWEVDWRLTKFSPDSRFLVLGANRGLYHQTYALVKLNQGRPLVKELISPKGGDIGDVTMSPNGRRMAFCRRFASDRPSDHREQIDVFDLRRDRWWLPAHELLGGQDNVYKLAFSDDSDHLASTGTGYHVIEWDLNSPDPNLSQATVHPGGQDSRLRLTDIRFAKPGDSITMTFNTWPSAAAGETLIYRYDSSPSRLLALAREGASRDLTKIETTAYLPKNSNLVSATETAAGIGLENRIATLNGIGKGDRSARSRSELEQSANDHREANFEAFLWIIQCIKQASAPTPSFVDQEEKDDRKFKDMGAAADKELAEIYKTWRANFVRPPTKMP